MIPSGPLTKRLASLSHRFSPWESKVIPAACLAIVAVVLTLGLWPFRAPTNSVSWLAGENGLSFGPHGAAFTRESLLVPSAPSPSSCSLEVWVRPANTRQAAAILAFDSSAEPTLPFSLREYLAAIIVQRYVIDAQGNGSRSWFVIDRVLRAREKVFLALVAGKPETIFYVNGVPVASSAAIGFACSDLAGRLVLGTSTVDDPWSGQILGLAIYSSGLTAAQVAEHFRSWTANRGPAFQDEEKPLALYLFDEHAGTLVHNRAASPADLAIPPRYTVLHPAFLRPVWAQFSYGARPWARRQFWLDIAENVVGFVPVGFLFLAYFSRVKPVRRGLALVIVLGFLVSLTIEVLQHFLPTRDSGMNDLITNTAGTLLGALLFRRWERVLGAIETP